MNLLLFILLTALISDPAAKPSMPGNTVNKEEKIASISFASSGCFSARRESIDVLRKGDTLFVTHVLNETTTKFTWLSADQLTLVENFMAELRSLKDGGLCTTVDNYKVTYQNQLFSRTDRSCGWNGFDKLKNALFGRS